MKKFKKMYKLHNLHQEDQQGREILLRGIMILFRFYLFIGDGEPSCFQEAIDCVDNAKWKMAMKEEMDSLEKKRNGNWLNSLKIEKLLDVSGSSS